MPAATHFAYFRHGKVYNLLLSPPPSLPVGYPLVNQPKKMEFDDGETDDNSDTVWKTMLDRYLEDPKIDGKRELNVLTFWQENA